MRTKAAEVDSQFLISDLAPFEELVRRASSGTRFQLLLISVLAAAAAILVGVGLYGVLSTMVRQRTNPEREPRTGTVHLCTVNPEPASLEPLGQRGLDGCA